MDLLDRGVVNRTVEDDFAAGHRDNSVAGVKYMLHVVRDEDAGKVLRF
jgi:hypothetical protein